MRKQAIIATLLSLAFAALSQAQVIYEPVQSQYRTEHSTYYYGGSNPRVHEYTRQKLDCFYGGRYTRDGAYGVGYLHRNLIGRPPQYVVSDCAPYLNAIVYGYTSVDARNEAYDRVPRFFRMADLWAAAVRLSDGSVLVPAQAPGVVAPAGTIDIRPSNPSTRPLTNPAANKGEKAEPKAILIIPQKTRGVL